MQKKVQNLIFRWSYHSDLLYNKKSENFKREKKKIILPKNKNAKCQMRRLVFDQSSPAHPASDFRGGTLSVREKDGQRMDILVSNIRFSLENIFGPKVKNSLAEGKI